MVIFHSCVSLPEGNGGFKLINQRYSGAATPGPARLSLAQRRLSSWGSQAAPYFRLEAPSGLVAAEAKFENPPPSLICCWNIWGVAIQKNDRLGWFPPEADVGSPGDVLFCGTPNAWGCQFVRRSRRTGLHNLGIIAHDGSMVLVYIMPTWLGYMDGIHVTIKRSQHRTMDPSWVVIRDSRIDMLWWVTFGGTIFHGAHENSI